jgi:hypothetical protein
MIIKLHTCPILFTLLLLTFCSKGQLSVGVDAGASYNHLSVQNFGFIELSKKLGPMVNIDLSYEFNDHYALEFSPHLVQKNYGMANSNKIFQRVRNTYVVFPVSLKYKIEFAPKLYSSLSAGIYYGYWLASRITGVAPNVFESATNAQNEETIVLQKINYSYPFNSEFDRRHELGWLGKLGLTYAASKKIAYQVNFHYYQAATGQQKKTVQNDPYYNRTYALTTGLLYRISR